MLTLTITGLFIAALVSIISIVYDKRRTIKLKILLTALIIGGLGIAFINTFLSDKEKKH